MQNNKILSFLVALLVSVGLWVYAVTVVNPDDTKTISDVKVVFVGTAELTGRKLMLTGGEDQRITVEISGRRSDLRELSNTSLEVVADLKNIDAAGNYELSWILDPPSTVASGDISVVSSSASRIQISVSERLEKPEVPVTVENQVTPAQGFLCDPVVLSAETVSVSGPAQEVSRIAKAIISIAQENAFETVTQDIACRFVDQDGNELVLSQYVSVSHPEIRASVSVLPYKQVALKYELIPGGGATENDVKVTISPEYIIVTGTQEALAAQPDEIVIKSLDLAQITEDKRWSVTPELAAGVTNRASSPSVQISLEFEGLATKRFTIRCSDIVRLDNVHTREFGEQNVVIMVRGRADVVNALNYGDIHVTADMEKDFDPATMTVTLNVEISNSAAGVIGGPNTAHVIDSSENEAP